jgi:hypothetical protein
MRYSKDTLRFVDGLVSYYSVYDKDAMAYLIDARQVNEFDLSKLSAHIMADNPDYAAESTGLDNPNFADRMLPALQKILKNSSDNENRAEFACTWQTGIVEYQMNTIQELLDSRLEYFNDYHLGESA